MTKYSAKQWFVKERSGDNINIEETFELITKELSTDDLKEGDLFLKAHFFSNDPTQRIWVNKDSVKERLYRAPIEKGDLMETYDSTVVVSVAAGATGSVVCQIAKNVLGIKNVVGIAGSDAKCELLKKSCGCDYALNYRSPTFKQDFDEATKDDIDVYFDNVGGEILDMALLRMKEYGRIVSCGAISMYNDMKGGKASAGISREAWSQVYCHKVRIEGFIVIQFADQLPKALADLVPWLMEGKIHLIKEIWDARIEDVPQGMLKLFKGENTGKLITKVIHE
ncbi:hypothetical protein TWF788_007138 [Orbilia oligospora]|uniref:Enoyl reductase (ER) domain-containing protein n=1 Tax=Orbilia oligospora TaxID=2813651 RepID=A0A7C8U0Z2_ORBOL|nr:hypothetical protein TWF788_007138 [Orbilia oligospora]